MTDEEKITLVKMMTEGVELTDTVVSAYLALAKDKIYGIAYPFGNVPETFPTRYDGVQVEIAADMINKRGAEGEIVHLENGVSRHWDSGDVSPALLRRITPCAVPIGATYETNETQSTGN